MAIFWGQILVISSKLYCLFHDNLCLFQGQTFFLLWHWRNLFTLFRIDDDVQKSLYILLSKIALLINHGVENITKKSSFLTIFFFNLWFCARKFKLIFVIFLDIFLLCFLNNFIEMSIVYVNHQFETVIWFFFVF